MALTLNRQLATIVCFLMTYSTASNEICGNYVTYSVKSRRNATGYREVSSDLLAVQDGVAPDVRLELQQKSCVTEGIRRLLIKTFIGLPEPRLPPPGYELVPELGWYRLHLTPLTWEEARQACVAEGAHLAVLNSQEEADALKGIFARAPAQIPGATYHHVAIIGFSDLVEGKFYTIFALDQRVPPPGYEMVPGVGWYRLHLTPLTWEEARLACEAEGAHLAVLNSQEEAAALKGIFARAPATIPQAAWANFAYIGFSDATEGHYITIFGSFQYSSGCAINDKKNWRCSTRCTTKDTYC